MLWKLQFITSTNWHLLQANLMFAVCISVGEKKTFLLRNPVPYFRFWLFAPEFGAK